MLSAHSGLSASAFSISACCRSVHTRSRFAQRLCARRIRQLKSLLTSRLAEPGGVLKC
jgi:hypothetical protein